MVAHNAPHSGNEGAVLQAPYKEVRAMRHVESPERRIYAGNIFFPLDTEHSLNNNNNFMWW